MAITFIFCLFSPIPKHNLDFPLQAAVAHWGTSASSLQKLPSWFPSQNQRLPGTRTLQSIQDFNFHLPKHIVFYSTTRFWF